MTRKSKAQLLEQFKEYAVLHQKLATVDMHLMRAIREPTGFAHVLISRSFWCGKDDHDTTNCQTIEWE